MTINWNKLSAAQYKVITAPLQYSLISGWNREETARLAAIKLGHLIENKEKINRPSQVLIITYELQDLDLFRKELESVLDKEFKYWANRIGYLNYETLKQNFTIQEYQPNGITKPRILWEKISQERKLVFVLGNTPFKKQDQENKNFIKELFSHVVTLFWTYEKDEEWVWEWLSHDEKHNYISLAKDYLETKNKYYENPDNQIKIDEEEINQLINNTNEAPYESYWIIGKIYKIQKENGSYKDCRIYTNTEEEKRKYNLIFPEIFRNEFKIFINWLEIANLSSFEKIDKDLLDLINNKKDKEIQETVERIQAKETIKDIFLELLSSGKLPYMHGKQIEFLSIIEGLNHKQDIEEIKERIWSKSLDTKNSYSLALTKLEKPTHKPKYAFLIHPEEPTEEDLQLSTEKIFVYCYSEFEQYKKYDAIQEKKEEETYKVLWESVKEKETIEFISRYKGEISNTKNKIFLVYPDASNWKQTLSKHQIRNFSFYEFLSTISKRPYTQKINPITQKKALIQTYLEQFSVPKTSWDSFYKAICLMRDCDRIERISELSDFQQKPELTNLLTKKEINYVYEIYRKYKNETKHKPEYKFIDILAHQHFLHNQNQIEKLCREKISDLIFLDYYLLSEEELSWLSKIIAATDSVLLISKHNSEIYKSKPQIQNLGKQLLIAKKRTLTEEYSQTTNYSLSLLNKLLGSNLTNPDLPGEKPITYIANSQEEEINWVKSKIQTLSNFVILVKSQETVEKLKPHFSSSTAIYQMNALNEFKYENVFIMNLNSNFCSWANQHQHSQLFYNAITSTTKRLFLSSDSQDISPILQEIKDLTTIESESDQIEYLNYIEDLKTEIKTAQELNKSFVIVTSDENKYIELHLNRFIDKMLFLCSFSNENFLISKLSSIFLEDKELQELFKLDLTDYISTLETIYKCRKHNQEYTNNKELLNSIFNALNIWIQKRKNINYQIKRNTTDLLFETINNCQNLDDLIKKSQIEILNIKKHADIDKQEPVDYVYILGDQQSKNIKTIEGLWKTKVKEKMILVFEKKLISV
ncbi:hypothetical protein MHSWG343_08700 [Candidatus Mycoplasma haematohominis]|uniref:Uncharacterized protein n=1 Tax=Candidatus Mycoplasma haematohominis TaxID=1494318 RepID=A0A478FQV0_9MOLU|nr:hypothetical protein MHSWG343_08700 [Candidatus Mycoplasma haemohominis]